MRGLLLFGDTERCAALRHEIPIAVVDPVLFAEMDGRRYVLTSALEHARVKRALPDAEVLDFFGFGYNELVEGGMSLADAEREAVARAVPQIGIEAAVVPGDLPLALGDRLRREGIALTFDDPAVGQRRRAKGTAGARRHPRRTAGGRGGDDRGARAARPCPAGNGRPAAARRQAAPCRRRSRDAARRVRGARCPCPPDVIVVSAWQGYGHEPGSGPLPTGLPIHVDIWPRDESSACWADMARTFMVGDPAPEHAGLIAEQARLVRSALEQAQAAVRPGITGRELFDHACDLFESSGYRTQRTAQSEDDIEGFQFSLGHGVGLEPHEDPHLGLAGHDPLVAGDVLAIEPGLWDRRVGGVGFEDLVLVTETGCELLTRFPYDLTPRAQAFTREG